MDKTSIKIDQSVKKRFKKLFHRTISNSEPSTSSGQGPGASAVLVPGPPPASDSPHAEPNNSTQHPPSAPDLLVLPTMEQSTAHDTWSGLKRFACSLGEGSEVFRPLKHAIDKILEGVEAFDLAVQNREDYQKLRDQLNTLFNDLAGYFGPATPPRMTASIVNLAHGIERELAAVRQKQHRDGVGRYMNAETDANQILEHYRHIQGLLQRLTLNANVDTWRSVNEQIMETHLSKLPNSSAARYRSTKSTVLRDECTPNTRVKVLNDLYEWARDSKSQKVYWLNGMAGTGKTTIAYSFCKELERSQGLAASFFCSRQLQECREVDRVVPTISYQLSRFSLPFRAAVSQVLEMDPDVHNQPVLDQFRQLVFEPMVLVKSALPTSLVVVVDALDECDDNQGAEILKCLLLYAQDLPVKFFVASRPDAKILDSIRRQQGGHTPMELRLHDLDRSIVEEDIRTYLRTKIASHVQLPAAHLDILVKRSGVLFIYAATVARYIEADNFSRATKRLKEVLASVSNRSAIGNTDKEINELYNMILSAAFDSPTLTESDRADMKQILNTVVCALEPLSIEVMAGLLGLDSETVHAALRPLLSVLQVSDTTRIITTLHESFSDYVLDKSRSDVFHCDQREQNVRLTQLCFDQINIPNPPFNICGLQSSYTFDQDITDLPARVENAISKELRYACRYWGVHMMLAGDSQPLADMLLRLLSDRFLLWLEVVNLCEYVYDGVKTLYRMQKWASSTHYLDENVKQLLRDAWMFAVSFSSSPARLSTPHIYISALTFWPDDSPMAKFYKQDTGTTLITGASTAMNLRSVIPLSVQNTRSGITSLSYSPDGAYIASSSDDGTIRVWDAHTGQPVGQPLEGHTRGVASVAYSPDGAYIVSGSWDHTIRIWNAHTCQPVGEPLDGHNERVRLESVAYSPDGAYIVSGSDDHTIRIQDSCTGQLVGQPLKGHTGPINSIVYSPDGAYIVSGSDDRTIYIWDTHTHQPVGQPLKGHTNTINSVAYSTDGAYIASGSRDKTIRIWDAQTRQPVGLPLEGHIKPILSVAYSPDDAHIVSSSEDCTIRIWDAQTRQLVGQPLEGHAGAVYSAVYSPDGAYIASCSWDDTIRIWDVHTCQRAGQLSEGHTGSVSSVAYSPDGAYIVSGSDDHTIRIQDSYTGQLVGQPLEGHIRRVTSVAYSPDGAYVVSGSYDKTIRTWDTQTCQLVGQPLEGHTKPILSVAYSPDGAHIASGSKDCTICIWDAQTRQLVGQPLEGHTSYVHSVAYSSDGACIVSGSDDGTIRIWDAQTRQQAGQPLEGHTRRVASVAYSPDGVYIASGSYDFTIRIWDAQTRQQAGQPLEGHTSYVHSVAYSPDGACIISGSNDGTIRIWDAQTRQQAGQPLEGHTDRVNSVVYSPDGAYITSGSWENTIRIWDTQPVIARTIVRESHNHNSQTAHPLHVAPEFKSIERLVLCTLGCQSDCPHMAWTLNEDGWIFFEDDYLIWVPPDLRAALLNPQTATVVYRRGFLQLDLDRNKLGDHWCENFRPGRSVIS